MYAVFSYDQMAIGAQWSALWYYENQLVHFETRAWNCAGCSTGGPGFTDWSPPPDQWKAGEYHVIIFVGEQWKVIGQFLVQGEPPTAIPTLTVTFTPSPRPSRTATPTKIPTASQTPMPPATATATTTP